MDSGILYITLVQKYPHFRRWNLWTHWGLPFRDASSESNDTNEVLVRDNSQELINVSLYGGYLGVFLSEIPLHILCDTIFSTVHVHTL